MWVTKLKVRRYCRERKKYPRCTLWQSWKNRSWHKVLQYHIYIIRRYNRSGSRFVFRSQWKRISKKASSFKNTCPPYIVPRHTRKQKNYHQCDVVVYLLALNCSRDALACILTCPFKKSFLQTCNKRNAPNIIALVFLCLCSAEYKFRFILNDALKFLICSMWMQEFLFPWQHRHKLKGIWSGRNIYDSRWD